VNSSTLIGRMMILEVEVEEKEGRRRRMAAKVDM
jgi:hypothetical protein